MIDDYTPTTDTVREAYASDCDPLICGPDAVDSKRAEFDRWLSVTPAIIAAIEAAMIEHGPDGHTDGAEQIAEAAIAALRADARNA